MTIFRYALTAIITVKTRTQCNNDGILFVVDRINRCAMRTFIFCIVLVL